MKFRLSSRSKETEKSRERNSRCGMQTALDRYKKAVAKRKHMPSNLGPNSMKGNACKRRTRTRFPGSESFRGPSNIDVLIGLLNKRTNTYNNDPFVVLLKGFRNRAGNMSQEALAEDIGVSAKTIQRYEQENYPHRNFYVVYAMSFPLELNKDEALSLLNAAGYALIKGNRLHAAYEHMLDYTEQFSIDDCDEFLRRMSLQTLSSKIRLASRNR